MRALIARGVFQRNPTKVSAAAPGKNTLSKLLIIGLGPLLDEMLTLSDLTRLEFHGPAAEIDQLREPLAALNPAWFVRECGVTR